MYQQAIEQRQVWVNDESVFGICTSPEQH